MIVEIRAKNCFVFNEQIVFSLQADMRNRKFSSNVCIKNNFKVLKTAGIYGPNNAGKTCLIKCISAIRNVLLNRENMIFPNIFSKWLVRAEHHDDDRCIDTELLPMIRLVAKNNVLFHLIDTSKFFKINEMKKILLGFAERIDVINMNNIPLQHTIELMKNKNKLQTKIVNFIKNADLYMDNFEYVELNDMVQSKETERQKPEEKILDLPENIVDQIRLVSTYKGVRVPSILFDSTGTKKMAAIASYVIEALEQGRILVVDELDSSIHFRLTRAIVALFNNELNTDAQLICTVHDINLMDCKRLFRKEQIWFVDKDQDDAYVYSLADFTAEQGVRDTSDIIEKYRKGLFAALPEPELINSLLDIKDKSQENYKNEE